MRVAPLELVDGLSRRVDLPASLAISVGTEGTVELASFGDLDVRARLFDAGEAPIAAEDDRANDWNFRVGETLAPGRYRLEVAPVGDDASDATTTVSMREIGERRESPVSGSGSRNIELADDIVTLPLALDKVSTRRPRR